MAPIVPPQSMAGKALTLVVAIMSCLACLTVGAVSLVNDAANAWSADVTRELTIEIEDREGNDMDALTRLAARVAGETPGIGTVTIIDQSDTAKLLEPWLGRNAQLSELPVPRLVAVEIDNYRLLDLTRLRTRLAEAVPGAKLDDHRIWTDHLESMAAGTIATGFGILFLVLAATVLCVVFATRAAMAGNRDVVEVLHYVGASHRFIANEFQRHFLLLGLRGGLIGGLAAILFFAILSLTVRLGGAETDQIRALVGIPNMGLTGYIGALAIVALIAILTATTSRLTVRRYLAADAAAKIRTP
jgi:cell division transport system permease protein